jgi:uncharacterized delta-60 repeat protein
MIITTAAMQADEKIVVAGTTNGSTDFILARYNTDGELDPSFGNGGVIITDIGSPTDFLNAVVINPDGKIIAGGGSVVNGKRLFVLAGYTSSGILDNGFGNNGIILTDFNGSSSSLSSLALQPDGRIIAAGVSFTNNNSDIALARYNADGSPDLTFSSTGKTTSDFSNNDWGRSVVVNSDGKIYVGGQSLDASGYPHFSIACYNTDGSPDLSFHSGTGFVVVAFSASYDYLVNIRIQDDGKIVAAGHASVDPSRFDIALTRINTNGTVDNGFGSNGNGLVTANINSGSEESDYLVIQQDGKIVTGGVYTVAGSPTSYRFTGYRYNTDGTPDTGFGNGGSFTDFIPDSYFVYYSLFHQNDGKLLAVGESNGGTNKKQFISRFNANGTPDNTYGQNGTYELSTAPGLSSFQPDSKLLRTTYSTTNNGDIMLLRNNSDGTPDAGFGNGGTVITDFGGNESATSIGFQADGKIVIGGIWRDNNGSDFLVVRYNPDGTVDGSFGNGGYVRMNFINEDHVQSIAIASDGKIVFGGTSITFPPYFDRLKFYALVVRLNPDGSPDTNFGDQGKTVIDKSDYDNIGNVLVQNDNKIILTRYESSTTGSNPGVFMGRLNADGSIDNIFGQNGNTACDGGVMIQQIDQKILILGNKKNNKNNTDFTLARFDPEGNADLSFGANGKTTVSFTHVDNFFFNAFLSANSLFASGNGVDEMGSNLGMIAKFRLEPEPEYSISCPGNQVVNTDSNLCGAKVYGIDPATIPNAATVAYTLTGATTGSGNGSVSGLLFNTGVTTITYTLTDDATKSCSFNVTVQDNEVPVISDLGVSQTSLWPPHHKLRDITVNYSVSDNCSVANTQISISSNEPVQSSERDDESPDWEILDDHHIRLRAERLETGNGRIYTIKITATDVNGNQDTAITIVSVPKSMGRPAGEDILITVSPNPSPNYFFVTINSNSSDIIRVRLFDNRGTVISTMNNVSVQQTLRIGDELKAGIYFLEVTQSGITKTTKIVKQ